MSKIHVLPSGHFSFHEDDFSSAAFGEETSHWTRADTGDVVATTEDALYLRTKNVALITHTVFVGIFYFRSANGGRRAETRLTGKEAHELQSLLTALRSRSC